MALNEFCGVAGGAFGDQRGSGSGGAGGQTPAMRAALVGVSDLAWNEKSDNESACVGWRQHLFEGYMTNFGGVV